MGSVTKSGGSQELHELSSTTRVYKDSALNIIRFIETSQNKISMKMLASFDTTAKMTGGQGCGVVGQGGTLTGTAWAEGDMSGGVATRGLITFDAIADQLLFAFDLPELMVDTGVAAEAVLRLRLNAANDTDRFDFAIYTHDGVNLIDEVDQTISGGGVEADYSINLGALTWNKGDSLVIFIGNFETSAAGATTVSFYWAELEFTIGIEADTT